MSAKESRLLGTEFPPVSVKKWEAQIKRELQGKDYRSLLFPETGDDFDLRAYYTEEDIRDASMGQPDRYPYRRGVKLHNNWEIRENIVVEKMTVANRRAKDALIGGADTIGFIFQNQPKSYIEFSSLLKDISMEKTAVYFSCAENNIQLIEWLRRCLKNSKQDIRKIKGAFEFEINPDDRNSRAVAEKLVQLRSIFSPFFKMITVSAPAVETVSGQIAHVLAAGNRFLEYFSERKTGVDDLAPCLQFVFPVGADYFKEIAKFRSFRMLWATVVMQYKPVHECSCAAFVTAQIESENKPEYKHDQFISNTTKVMSAALGCADNIVIRNSSNSFTARINRNIQLIVKEEAYLSRVADPAGGSYYIETMTDKIAEAVWKKFQEMQ